MADHRDLDGFAPRPSVDLPLGSAPAGTATLTATPGKRAARASATAARPGSAGARADAATYVGRRVANRPVDAPSTTLAGDALDTGTIAAVLQALEPADQTTSFADEVTEAMPLLRVHDDAPATAVLPVVQPIAQPAPLTSATEDTTGSLSAARPGKRRAVKHSGRRGPLFRGLPSAPLLVGVTALAVSAGGAVTLGGTDLADSPTGAHAQAANALTGTSGTGSVTPRRDGTPTSRSGSRPGAADPATQQVVEQAAQQRTASLGKVAEQAEKRDAFIEKNQWQVPLDSYRVTARFGQYGLWASYHTGLDFAAPSGTPIKAIANGVVTSAGYDGSYGNKTVVTLDDGTELWFCHQTSFAVSVGDTVRGGEVIGYVGSTGNVTGPHVHVEVRPGGGDPIDPYAAFVEHGVTP